MTVAELAGQGGTGTRVPGVGPDLRHSQLYIETLTGSAETPVTFQTFDDCKEKVPELARVIHGRLADVAENLMGMNQRGAGVFVTVNETDLKGRRAENVVAVRSLFADFDSMAPAAFALDPTFVVTSVRGPHPYWVLDPPPELGAFESAQRQLAAFYGSDAAVHDLPRVMRLPGFLHRKAEPFLVTFAGGSLRRYALEEVLAAHPVAKATEKTHRPAAAFGPEGKIPHGRRREAWKTWAARWHNDGASLQQNVEMLMAGAHIMFGDLEEFPPRRSDAEGIVRNLQKKDRWMPLTAEISTRAGVGGPQEREPGEYDDATPAAGVVTGAERLTVTWDQYMAEESPSVPSLLGDALLVKAGGYTLLGGNGGVGKTILVANLLLFLADGRDKFLEFSLPGRPVRSLILEAEGNRSKFRDWIALIAKNLGIEKSPPISFHERRAELAISGPTLEAMIEESGAEVVFLDTIGRFWSGDENSSTEWRSGVTVPLAALGDRHNVAFIFGDHFTKPNENRSGQHQIRGSAAKIQDAGAVMRLEVGKAGKASRILYVDRVRDGGLPDPNAFPLEVDLQGGTVHRDEREDAKPQPIVEPRLLDVQRFVQELGKGGRVGTAMLRLKIESELGLEKSRAEDLIKAAVRHGLIERVTHGYYGPPGELLT